MGCDLIARPVERRPIGFHRLAEAELRGLDDRTLHDMGLSRSDIRAAVAGEIYRPGNTVAASNDAGSAKVQVLKAKDVVAA